MITLSGTGLSAGLASGPALILRAGASPVSVGRDGSDRDRLHDARSAAREELRARIDTLPEGPARQIVAAHMALVDDPLLIAEFERGLAHGQGAAQAVASAAASLEQRLAALADPALRARAADIRDVCDCIGQHLHGGATKTIAAEGRVVCAAELSAAQVLRLVERRPAAFVLETPVTTSHAVILIRALAVPAVIGVSGITSRVSDGDQLLVDAEAGRVVLHPQPADVAHDDGGAALQCDPLPARTMDGIDIAVTASVVDAGDVRRAALAGADGIGLLRTDWLFLRGDALPSEETQYRMYRDVAVAAADAAVTVRLADLGGDKRPPALPLPHEPNPALGLRGIRLALAYPDLLRTQLRALRRAFQGRLRLLLPMVNDVGDVRRVREFLSEPEADGPVEIGVMIETPAAAILADQLAAVVDFFSLGTNDLAQYVLAADRESTACAEAYSALHPAVLRLVHTATLAANRRSVPVSICGELGADDLAVPLLIGMGITGLTVAPADIARVKRIVRNTSASAGRQRVEEILSSPTADAVVRALGHAAPFSTVKHLKHPEAPEAPLSTPKHP